MELLPCPPAGDNDSCIIDVNSFRLDTNHVNTNRWNLHYDKSKTYDEVGAGCILVDPNKKKYLISFPLEFKCTNNPAEYEELIICLKKFINLKVEGLKSISDMRLLPNMYVILFTVFHLILRTTNRKYDDCSLLLKLLILNHYQELICCSIYFS